MVVIVDTMNFEIVFQNRKAYTFFLPKELKRSEMLTKDLLKFSFQSMRQVFKIFTRS